MFENGSSNETHCKRFDYFAAQTTATPYTLIAKFTFQKCIQITSIKHLCFNSSQYLSRYTLWDNHNPYFNNENHVLNINIRFCEISEFQKSTWPQLFPYLPTPPAPGDRADLSIDVCSSSSYQNSILYPCW